MQKMEAKVEAHIQEHIIDTKQKKGKEEVAQETYMEYMTYQEEHMNM